MEEHVEKHPWVDPPLLRVHFESSFFICYKALDFLRKYALKSELPIHSMSVLLVPEKKDSQDQRFFPLSILGVPLPPPRFIPALDPRHLPDDLSLSQWACVLKVPLFYGDLTFEKPQRQWKFPDESKKDIPQYEDQPKSLVVIPLLSSDRQAWGVISVFFSKKYGYLRGEIQDRLAELSLDPTHPELIFPEETEEIRSWAASLGVNFSEPSGLDPDTKQKVREGILLFARETGPVCEFLRWAMPYDKIWDKEDYVDFWNRLPLRAYGILCERSIREKMKPLSKEDLATRGARSIAVLFADLRGFTNVCNALGMGNRQIPKVLCTYFEKMWGIVLECGGEIDKFEGDGIMALFGTAYQTPHNEEKELAVQAVEAAMRMYKAFPETRQAIVSYLQKKEESSSAVENARQLKMGIGIMVGRAHVEFFGSDWQTTYTALGPVVNFAKKLETIAAKNNRGHIIVAVSSEVDERAFRALVTGIQALSKNDPKIKSPRQSTLVDLLEKQVSESDERDAPVLEITFVE